MPAEAGATAPAERMRAKGHRAGLLHGLKVPPHALSFTTRSLQAKDPRCFQAHRCGLWSLEKPQNGLTAAGQTEGKVGSRVPGSPFCPCLLPPPPVQSGVSICGLSRSLSSIRADLGQEDRPGDSSIGWGAGLPPMSATREWPLQGSLGLREKTGLCCRGHLGAPVWPSDPGSQGQDSTVGVLDCLKLGTGLEVLIGPHAQHLWHPEAPTPVASHFLRPAVVQRLGAKEEMRPLVPLSQEVGCRVPWGWNLRQRERSSDPPVFTVPRVLVRVEGGSRSRIRQGHLAEQTGPWQGRQLPGHMPCLLRAGGLYPLHQAFPMAPLPSSTRAPGQYPLPP